MSSIQPIVFSPGPATLGRGNEPVSRPARAQPAALPVLPPAVILPRTAAWLTALSSTPSETAAAAESDPVQTGSARPSVGPAGLAQTGSVSDSYSQTGVGQVTATAAAQSQAAAAPGFGSVLQLV